MDRFRMLEVFVRVADLASFTRAADALDLPRATVTELVQALESRLECTLLHRTTRRVALTPEGAAFYERATRVLQDLDDAEADLGGARSTPRGRLRVDVPAATGRHVIAPALPDFFARYPGIELELGSSDRPVELLMEGVDCVIRGGLVHDDTLVARKLCDLEVATCAAPAYLERHGVPVVAGGPGRAALRQLLLGQDRPGLRERVRARRRSGARDRPVEPRGERRGHVRRGRRRRTRARPDSPDGLRAVADRRRGASRGARGLVGAAAADLRDVAAPPRPLGAPASVRRLGRGAVRAAAIVPRTRQCALAVTGRVVPQGAGNFGPVAVAEVVSRNWPFTYLKKPGYSPPYA